MLTSDVGLPRSRGREVVALPAPCECTHERTQAHLHAFFIFFLLYWTITTEQRPLRVPLPHAGAC